MAHRPDRSLNKDNCNSGDGTQGDQWERSREKKSNLSARKALAWKCDSYVTTDKFQAKVFDGERIVHIE